MELKECKTVQYSETVFEPAKTTSDRLNKIKTVSLYGNAQECMRSFDYSHSKVCADDVHFCSLSHRYVSRGHLKSVASGGGPT